MGLLTTQQAAEQLGVTPGTLMTWRSNRRYSLKFVKVGSKVRYRAEDIEAFLQSRTRSGDGSEHNTGTSRAARANRRMRA